MIESNDILGLRVGVTTRTQAGGVVCEAAAGKGSAGLVGGVGVTAAARGEAVGAAVVVPRRAAMVAKVIMMGLNILKIVVVVGCLSE